MEKRISRAQIARIWASSRQLGLDRDLLYLLVPRGSISAMTQLEASLLIDHLNELGARGPEPPRARPSDPTAATPEQHHFIHFLLGRLGWLQQPERTRGFLLKYAGVATVEEIRDRARASAIIEALKAMAGRVKGRVGN